MNGFARFSRQRGFSRIEAMAMTVALSFLVLAVAGMTRVEPAKTATCFNNLRQLDVAVLSYADDNGGNFPPRVPNPFWPERLRPYFKQVAILTCPSDGPSPPTFGLVATNIADAAPRSYLLNGWSDYYLKRGFSMTNPFPVSAIAEPAQTVLFGEKDEQSRHFWMDYLPGDDYLQVEQGRHQRSGPTSSSGASNHAFADGSVRLLKWGSSLYPVNLWAVEPEWRVPDYGP